MHDCSGMYQHLVSIDLTPHSHALTYAYNQDDPSPTLPRLQVIRAQHLLINTQLIDPLLRILKRRKENSIYDARPRHAHAEAAVHARIQELDFRARRCVFAACEAVALVDAFCRVDWEDLYWIKLAGWV
jgi:hypothetical protein